MFKKIAVGVVSLSLMLGMFGFSAVPVANAQAMSLQQLVLLFISLGIISQDKVNAARAAVGLPEQPLANPSTGTVTPTNSNATVAVVGGPTIALTYDSANKESALTATFNLAITAGSSDLNIITSAVGSSFVNQRGVGVSLNSYKTRININQGEKTDQFGRDYTIIRAGQTVTATAVMSANPRHMFAGSYYGTITNLYTNDAQGNLSPIYLPSNKTTLVTVVGEVSPYITSVTNPISAGQTMTVQGQRLSGGQILVDANTPQGIAYKDGNGSSLEFIWSGIGISTGQHSLTVNNPSTGLSNNIWFTVLSSASQSAPSISTFSVSPSSVVLGQTTSWSGYAVKGSSDIKQYRAYVVGSNNGKGSEWTQATNPNQAYFGSTVGTTQNSASFYNGAGTYTVRFEVQDTAGRVASAERTLTVTPQQTAGQASLTLLSPKGGESYVAGQGSINVSYTMSPAGNYDTEWILIPESGTQIKTGGGSYYDPTWPGYSLGGQSPNGSISASSPTLTIPGDIPAGRYHLSVYLLPHGTLLNSSSRPATILNSASSGVFTISSQVVAPAVQTAPSITSFSVSPSTVVQGENISWYGTASKGSSPITQYHAYVVGSNNGQGSAWTNAASGDSVSFNSSSISTAQNSASFYNGTGQYTVRFEVRDANGLVSTADNMIVVAAPTPAPEAAPVNNAPTTYISGDRQLTVGQTGSWTFGANDQDGDLYQWQFCASTNSGCRWTGISGSSVNGSYSTSFSTAGTYTWVVNAVDSSGVTGNSSITVTVTQPTSMNAGQANTASVFDSAGGILNFFQSFLGGR